MPRQVAHALLTRPPLNYLRASSPITPFDLNVLCTPPAFILSQDQTLELIVLKSLFRVFQSVRAFFLSFFYFCLSSILFQNFTRSFFRTIFCFRFVLLQSLVVQFSMTNCAVSQNIQLRYYITSTQALSSAFFIFFGLFCTFFRLVINATSLYYHITFKMSIPF